MKELKNQKIEHICNELFVRLVYLESLTKDKKNIKEINNIIRKILKLCEDIKNE